MRAGEKANAVSESVVLNPPSGATAAAWGAVGEEAAQGGGQEQQHILSGVPVEGQVSTDGPNVLLDLDTGTYVINKIRIHII